MNGMESHQIGAMVETPGPEAHVQIRNDLSMLSPSEGEVLIKLECTGVWKVTVIVALIEASVCYI